MANSGLNSQQSAYLKERVTALLSGKDLNVFGYDVNEIINSLATDEQKKLYQDSDAVRKSLADHGIEVTNDNAIKNQVLLWLMSKRGDFPREDPNNVGILYELLGKIANDQNLSEWEARFRTAFQNHFGKSGLVLNYLKIHFNPIERKVMLSMIVTDAGTKSITQLIERFDIQI